MIHTQHIAHEHLPLKKVLMHRPDKELQKVTPDTLDFFHFADVPDIDAYLKEFDNLVEAFQTMGTEVILVNELLEEDDEACAYIENRPNMVFTRDLAVVTPKGGVMLGMQLEGRQGDPAIIKKAMQKLEIPILGELEPHGGLLEGGGITYYDGHTVIVGRCSRTNPKGMELIETYMKQAGLTSMITIPCYPHEIHIDGILVFIDKSLAIVHPPSLDYAPAIIKNLKTGEVRENYIMDWLKENDIETLVINDQERDDAWANWVLTGPKQIVGFEWADRIMNEVEKRGGRAIGVSGKELFKGKGGPHCMTCPLER